MMPESFRKRQVLSEVTAHRRPVIGDNVPDIFHAGEVDQQPLKAHTEARMHASAEFS